MKRSVLVTFFVLFVLTILTIEAQAQTMNCEIVKQEASQKHFKCLTSASAQPFHLLDLSGSFKTISYYHGKFLSHEIENNLLKGLRETERIAMSDLPAAERDQIASIRSCLMMRYKAGSSLEFKEGIKSMYRGMRASGSKVSEKELEDAHYLIEFSIFSDALIRAIEENSSKLKTDLAINCAPYLVGKQIGSAFKSFGRFLRKLKMGCTGIVASSATTSERVLIHGRNFDTGQLGIVEKAPVVQIQRISKDNYNVGLTTAGVSYAGGISGFNSSGLSISMHELQTRKIRIYADWDTTDVSTYVAHEILMKSKDLSQAINLIKEKQGYGAWTFLIADAKSQEIASVELSGDLVVTARKNHNSYMTQTNHFIAPETRKVGFEYSANKTLESISRFNYVEREFKNDLGKINEKWVLDHLTGHWDEFMGLRSFGRTTTKVYTAMSHVMIPQRNEWWMTLTDKYPTNRSAFVGLRLNLQNPIPIEIIGEHHASETLAPMDWYNSLENYVFAWMQLDKGGKYKQENFITGASYLEKAQAQTLQLGIIEYPYHFMWARIQIQLAALDIKNKNSKEAIARLQLAQDKIAWLTVNAQMHDFEKAQLVYWRKRIADLRSVIGVTDVLEQKDLDNGLVLFNSLYKQYPYQNLFKIMGQQLQKKMSIGDIISESPELVTVE